MNERFQAILLKLIVELKKLRWSVDKNWEVALKADGYVTLTKQVNVQGHLGDGDPWDDSVNTSIYLKLLSDDNITYFPEFTIIADIIIGGTDISKDISTKMDNDTAFTEKDVNNEAKIASAAKKITRNVEDLIEHEYSDCIDQNSSELLYQKRLGVDPDKYDDVP